MSAVPFHRTVLSAALDWHAINAMANRPEPMDLREAQQAVLLAAALHDDPVKTKCAAWRAFIRCPDDQRQTLLFFVQTHNPQLLAELTAKELENDRQAQNPPRDGVGAA